MHDNGARVVDSENVAQAYRDHGSRVEGPFVPEDHLAGAVALLRELVEYPGLIGAALPEGWLDRARAQSGDAGSEGSIAEP